MFTTEHFRRPSLHEIISRLSETRPDTHGSYFTFMAIKSTEMSIAGKKKKKKRKKNKTSMLMFLGRLGIEEPEHLRMR